MSFAIPAPRRRWRSDEILFADLIVEANTWNTMRELLERFGEVTEEPDGSLTLTRQGRSLLLHQPVTNGPPHFGQLTALRRFLAETTPQQQEMESNRELRPAAG